MKTLILITLIVILLTILLTIYFKDNFTSKDLYNGKKWENYRLGDVYLQANDPSVVQNLDYHINDYPDSIAAEILKVKPYIPKNKKLLLDIISKKEKLFKFNNNDLVLHIRSGDVMCDENKRFIWYSKKDDTDWWNKVIDYIKKNGIQKVYILSGSHSTKCLTESMDYINDRKQFLEKNGLIVIYRLGQSPDDDIVFAIDSPHFISTGGGFGRMVYEIKNKWF